MSDIVVGNQIRGSSLDELLYRCLVKIKNEGHDGDKSSREIVGTQVVLDNPCNIWMINPSRKHDPIAQIAEVIWVLAGSNDISWLVKYLPRAVDFSDDGKTWRAGYGPILFNYEGIDNQGKKVITNQIEYVIDTLKKNPTSRQAVFTIWNPAKENTIGVSKDFPCNVVFQFLIRDNKLFLASYVRSNDVIWGMTGTNMILWSFLMQTIASILEVEVGSYVHNVGSLHYYTHHNERVDNIIKSYDELVSLNGVGYFQGPSYSSLKVKDFDIYAKLFNTDIRLREIPNDEVVISELVDFLVQNTENYCINAKATLLLPLMTTNEYLCSEVYKLMPRDEYLSYIHPHLSQYLVSKSKI